MTLCGAMACSPTLGGEAVVPARDLPAFQFTQANGQPFSTGAEADRFTVLFFGYTHCPDICPTTLADWKRVHDRLGRDTSQVRFVFVSVDPTRDTPQIAQDYVAAFHPAFIGLAGDANTIRRMVRAFGVAVIPDNASADAPRPIPGPAAGHEAAAHDHGSAGLISHSSQAFLINRRGQLIAMYPPGSGWPVLLADLKALL